MLRRISFLSLLSLALAASAFAQTQPQVARTPSAIPTPFVPAPASGVAADQPAAADANPQDMVKLQFPNSDVVDVLHFYEGLTNSKLVIDNNVQGKVNIFLSQEVPREEAIRIIEMNLALNGFSLVPAGGDVVEVVGVNKNPRAAAVPIVSDPADIPDGAKVVSYLFRLKYADPQELQSVLSQYLAGIGGQAPILALPKSSSLLVTQSSDVLRKLVKMVQELDVPPAQVESFFIKLDRADASKVVDMLKDIFENGNDSGGGGGIRRIRGVPIPNAGPSEGDESAVLSENSLVVGKIKLEADVRTNRIHVITRPVNIPFIKKLIAEFDANVEFGKPVTRQLQYVSAADVLPVLVQALTEPGSENQNGQGLTPGGNNRNTNQNNPNRAPTPSSNGAAPGSLSDTASDSSLQVSEQLSTQPIDTTPQAVTVGNTKLIADARANSIIILGTRDVVAKVEKILDQMDVRAPQVALSTVIGELTLNNEQDFGADYFLQYTHRSNPNTGFGAGAATGNTGQTVLDPASLINFTQLAAAVPGSGGANVYLAAGNTLAAIVHLLDSTGRFRTISRPTVFTSNNKKAIIASGTEIPVPTNTVSSPTSGILTSGIAQQTNIEFKKIALQLEVVPLINANKEVSLDILQQLDSLTGQSTNVDGNAIPTVATRYIRTTVLAPNGSTIVLGGLIQDEQRRSRGGIPILDRIPLIGSLFAETSKIKNRTELIVLMRPEVSLSDLDLYRTRARLENKTHFGSEIDEDDRPLPTEGKQLPAPDLPPTK